MKKNESMRYIDRRDRVMGTRVFKIENLSYVIGNDIWKILRETDKEFIPPLSARHDTLQRSFAGLRKMPSPRNYFASILKQEFIGVRVHGRVVGILSYIPEYNVTINGNEHKCVYVSTVAVKQRYRGKGLTYKLYENLLKRCRGKEVLTRTWSTNYAHLHVLEKLGFECVDRIKDDRGEGLDTVYFMRGASDGR